MTYYYCSCGIAFRKERDLDWHIFTKASAAFQSDPLAQADINHRADR